MTEAMHMQPRVLTSRALRRWLDGRWALYFSHPGDFAQYGFESDRWQVLLQNALEAGRICLLGPARSHALSKGWLGALGGRAARVPALPAGGQRFVVLLDRKLRPRRTLHYDENSSLPSALDLVELSVAARQEGTRLRAGRPSGLAGRLVVAGAAAVAMLMLVGTLARARRSSAGGRQVQPC